MKTRRLKNRILLGFLAVISVLGGSIFALGFYMIKEDIYARAQRRVGNYIDSARTVYAGEIERIGNALELVNLQDDTETLRVKINLDYLYRIEVSEAAGCPSEIVRTAVKRGKPAGGTRIAEWAEIARMSPEVQSRSRITILVTAKAGPSSRKELDSAMVKEYAVPIKDSAGKMIQVVYGGRVANQDNYLVDRIRDLVFGQEMYEKWPVGTVTIFLDDVRICTNVLDENGNRAIGTRVSKEVYQQVVNNGQRWHDRAFVVNRWYMTAYEPIRNINGTIIGMLYVGMLESPFNALAARALAAFVAVVLLASAAAFVFAIWLADSVSRPLINLLDATKKLSRGELGHEVQTHGTILETNELAESFNEMSIKLEQREDRLKVTNEKLEDLNKSYLDLLGFVAHELKGILSSTMMNAYSLHDGFLGMINFKQKRAVDSICRNLDYLAATVKKFLNLSRIERGNLEINKTYFNLRDGIFEPAVQTFIKQISDRGMKLINEMDPAMRVHADQDLMQIVANNLINNAAKYGSDSGKIILRSRQDDKMATVEVYNDGRPITSEQMAKLFKKFSRLDVPEKKQVKGTGLGLYITRQIVESHGGSIRVEPKENGNSFIFTIERG
ncbi:MAG: HAMP domain-containing protein [Planctomycetes bacterium]|nr:HAMP domain-containing protein [Planctomycetota bacterium]